MTFCFQLRMYSQQATFVMFVFRLDSSLACKTQSGGP